eukprot:7180708-Prymnesium_polylepis.2
MAIRMVRRAGPLLLALATRVCLGQHVHVMPLHHRPTNARRGGRHASLFGRRAAPSPASRMRDPTARAPVLARTDKGIGGRRPRDPGRTSAS